MRPDLRRSLCAAALACLLAGCTSGQGGEDAGGETEPGAAAPKDDSAAGVEQFDPEDALVQQTLTLPQSPQDKVDIGVLSLEVEGQVMFLRLAVTPDFGSESDSKALSLFTSLGQTTFAPTLVDVENLKEYAVVQAGSGKRWASSDLGTTSMNGTPMLAYAVFAAPEDDISSIDVRVTDFWPAFTDVPITR
ncbi:MAG: hypothetical protein KY440_13335 [Actinobacteria bacterium]|nr:hypothetical protein [Actinomycetota bacterium]